MRVWEAQPVSVLAELELVGVPVEVLQRASGALMPAAALGLAEVREARWMATPGLASAWTMLLMEV